MGGGGGGHELLSVISPTKFHSEKIKIGSLEERTRIYLLILDFLVIINLQPLKYTSNE